MSRNARKSAEKNGLLGIVLGVSGCLGTPLLVWAVAFGRLGCFEMPEVGFGCLGLLCRKTGSVSGCLRVSGVFGVGQLLVRAWAGGCFGALGALV